MKNKFLILLSLNMFSCGTKYLTSKVSDPKKDSFKEESFIRYTTDRLINLEKTPFKGLSLCYQGSIKEGKKVLLNELNERKNSPSYWNEVGVCHFLEQSYSKADFYFDLSLQKANSSFYPPALNNKGAIQLKLRHFEGAIKYFKKAAGSKGEHQVPLFNMAQVYLQFNRLEQAGRIINDINSKNNKRGIKNDPDLLFSLGSYYLLKGNTQKAISVFQKIPRQYQKREDVALLTAIGLYENQKYYQAKKLLKGQTFIDHIPLKKSAQKLFKIIEERIKVIELKEKKGS